MESRHFQGANAMSRNLLMLAVFIAISLSSSIGRAGGAATLGVSVPAGQQLSFDQINHAPWDALLRKYCDAQGFVNYQAWQRSNQDQQALDNYLSQLSRAAANRPAAPAAKLAFWINAYNAVTIKGILREYPTTSIRNHTAKVFGYNIWDDLLLQVGNRTYSLNQMEHEVLRKMGEPRSFRHCLRLDRLSSAAKPGLHGGESGKPTGVQYKTFLCQSRKISLSSQSAQYRSVAHSAVVCRRLWCGPSCPAADHCSLSS